MIALLLCSGGLMLISILIMACNEAAVECKVPITEKNLNPGTYSGSFSLANNNQEPADAHNNLDLDLWISPPCNSQKGNNSVRNNQPPLQLAVEESKTFRGRSMTLVMVPNKVVTVQKPLDSLKKKAISANEVSAVV
ncbi:hypothetical protein AgCh_039995 [Apium graveolens]